MAVSIYVYVAFKPAGNAAVYHAQWSLNFCVRVSCSTEGSIPHGLASWMIYYNLSMLSHSLKWKGHGGNFLNCKEYIYVSCMKAQTPEG